MNGTDLRINRERLELSVDAVASDLGVEPSTLRQWESGQKPIPKRHRKHVHWHLYQAETEQLLVQSGVPECEWMKAWDPAQIDDVERSLQALTAHEDSCEVCRRRTRFLKERIGPRPQYPRGLGWRVLDGVFALFEAPTPLERAIRKAGIVLALLGAAGALRLLPFHEGLALAVYPISLAVGGILVFSVYDSLRVLHGGAFRRWLARCAAGATAMVGFVGTFMVSGYGSIFADGEPLSWTGGLLIGVVMGVLYATLWPLAKNLRRIPRA